MEKSGSKADSEAAVAESLYHQTSPPLSLATQALLGASTQDLGREGVCERADERIRELEAEISIVKSFRNAALGTTSPLPAEILSRIFVIIASSTFADRSSLSWLGITHVCQRWRAVALACTSLWSRIAFDCNPALTELMLARAMMVPLSVKIRTGRRLSLKMFEKTVSQPPLDKTLRSIEVALNAVSSPADGGCSNDLDSLPDFRSAINLEIFIARGTPYLHNPSHVSDKFLDMLEGFHALKHLELKECKILSEKMPAAVGMTGLQIRNTSDVRPSSRLFLESLASMPRLQHLDISCFLPRDGPSSSQPASIEQRVSLPSLQNLRLTGNANELSNFFVATQISREAQINVMCSGIGTAIEDHLAIFVAIQSSWAPDPTNRERNLQKLCIGNFGGRLPSPEILCWFGDALTDVNNDEKWRHTFSVKCQCVDNAADLLTMLCDKLDLYTLRSLTVAAGVAVSESHWFRCFSRLTKLETITLTNGTLITPFVLALGEDPARLAGARAAQTTIGAPVSTTHFPALQTIRFDTTDFNPTKSTLESEPWTSVKDLIGALRKRPKSHLVKTLKIDLCKNFSQGDYSILRGSEVVAEVQWDRWEHLST